MSPTGYKIAPLADMEEFNIDVFREGFKAVYGKPLPWHRFFFYSFAENEQYLKDKLQKYIKEKKLKIVFETYPEK